MSRQTDLPRQHDIRERVDRNSERMKDKEVDLDRAASDVETVRRTLENMVLGGTAEGSDAVEEAIETADEVAGEEFENEDKELEDMQRETGEHEGELEGRSDASEKDAKEIDEAEKAIKTRAAITEIARAKEAALRDIDFLAEQIRRAREARDESERVQQDLTGRVRSGRRR